MTDPQTNVTEFFYDKVGNKIRQIDAETKETLYEYDANDNLIKTIDPLGN